MNLIGYNCFGFCKYIAFIIVIHFFLSGLLSCIGFLGCSHPISIDKSGAIPSLREEPNPQRRTGAAMILGGSKDPRAVQALIDSLRHDPSGPVRMAAASSLGEIKDSRSVGPLIGALKDPDNVVRAATASSLGEIGDPKAIEPLKDALKDEDSGVRQAAASALNKIKGSCDRQP